MLSLLASLSISFSGHYPVDANNNVHYCVIQYESGIVEILDFCRETTKQEPPLQEPAPKKEEEVEEGTLISGSQVGSIVGAYNSELCSRSNKKKGELWAKEMGLTAAIRRAVKFYPHESVRLQVVYEATEIVEQNSGIKAFSQCS